MTLGLVQCFTVLEDCRQAILYPIYNHEKANETNAGSNSGTKSWTNCGTNSGTNGTKLLKILLNVDGGLNLTNIGTAYLCMIIIITDISTLMRAQEHKKM